LPAFPDGIDAVVIFADGRVVATDARDRLRAYDPARRVLLAELAMPTRAMLLRPSSDGREELVVPPMDRSELDVRRPLY